MRLLALLLLLPSLAFAQLTSDVGSIVSGGKLYKGVTPGGTGCDCGSTGAACTGTSVTHTVAGYQFSWAFSCSGGSCQCGRFLTGEPWVRNPSGGTVVLTGASPASSGIDADVTGAIGGVALASGSTGAAAKQGFAPRAVYYDANQNIRPSLPATISNNTTLVISTDCTRTFAGVTGDCPDNYTSACAAAGVTRYSTLSVLQALPPSNGVETFRPPIRSGTKPFYTAADFDFTRLPQRTDIAATVADYTNARARWINPYPDTFGGDLGRCFVPVAYGTDEYSAGYALAGITDMLKLTGNQPVATKRDAAIAVVQRGLDIYHSWQAGNKWPCGAGQCLGRKPLMVFMASLSTDAGIVNSVRASAALNQDFQEESQISVTPNSGGRAIWATTAYKYFDGTATQDIVREHWSRMFASKCYDGANGGNPAASCFDPLGNRAQGDPYGYIDGPAQAPGTIYNPLSTGPHIGYATLMHAWPQYCEAANEPESILYADRMYYPSQTTAPGLHLNTDPCAPPDPREPAACSPYHYGRDCLYYGARTGATDENSTWGPKPSNPSQCIPNNTGGNTGQTGRFSWLHGQRLMSLSTSVPGDITYNATPGYFAAIPRNQYASIRTGVLRCQNGVWVP